MPVTNLSDAIVVYRANAAKLFNDAGGPDPLPGEKPEDTKRRQGQLAAAFSQLSTAEIMDSAQTGRKGYAEVVALMTRTRTTADTICQQLASVAGTLNPSGAQLQQQLQIMKALTDALQALAQISPAAVWEKGSTSDGTAG